MIQGWECPPEEKWDRYIIDPQWSESTELSKHLADCPRCRFLVAERRRELEDLQFVWLAETENDVIKLLRVSEQIEEPEAARTRLAAEGERESEPAISAMLSSANKELALRAVRDPVTGDTWLYLIADDPVLYRNALVRPFGLQEEYLADSQGQLNLGKIEWPPSEKLAAEVRLPKASFLLAPYKDDIEKEKSIELSSPAGDRMRVSLSGEGRSFRLEVHLLDLPSLTRESWIKIAVRARGLVRILQLRPADTSPVAFENVGELGTLELFLFQ